MTATVKLWWHDGSTLDTRNHPTPLINEPEQGFETLTVGAAPVSSGAAPEDCHVAVIESPVALRYRVIAPGQSGTAGDAQAKPLGATGTGVATIGIVPGAVISLVETP